MTAEFPGFDPGVLKDVRIRAANDNKQMVVLAIQSLQDSVTVGRDKQESAADRNNGSFGTALTREQVDALSDDPDRDGASSCRRWPAAPRSCASTASKAASCRPRR